MRVCTVCDRSIAGNVSDPIIHLHSGHYHYRCFQVTFQSSTPKPLEPLETTGLSVPLEPTTPQQNPETQEERFPWDIEPEVYSYVPVVHSG